MKTKTFGSRLIQLLLPALFCISIQLHSQVTIGLGEEPIAGSILQLKEKANVTDNGINSYRGIVLPRVTLSDENELYPMFLTDPSQPYDSATNPETAAYAGAKAALKSSHTGLTVYNTNGTVPFFKGLYIWSGDKWVYCWGASTWLDSGNQGTPASPATEDIYHTGDVGIGIEEAKSGSILDVSSTEKGIYIPLLGNSDIEAIDVSNIEEGLTVFNTDTRCFSYWKLNPDRITGKWLNMCGSSAQAEAEIGDCLDVKAKGIYIEGTSLTTSNYLSIPVTVISDGGTYSVTATTSNGYFFTATGIFPSAGTFIVNATGVGTPTSANPTPGDAVTITINNQIQGCTTKIPVLAATPDYTIVAVTPRPSEYIPGQPLDDNNFLSVTLSVKIPGRWNLITSTIKGYQFYGEGLIEEASGYNPNGSFPQIVTVQVPGYGTPDATPTGRTDRFLLSSVNSATSSNYPFDVKIAALSWNLNCSASIVNGTFTVGQGLAGTENIILSINATVPGPTTIYATGAGMTFKKAIALTTGTQTVTLNPDPANGDNAPTLGGTRYLSVSGDGFSGTCNIPVTINVAEATIDPNTIVASYLNEDNTSNATGRYILRYTVNTLDQPDKKIKIKLSGIKVTGAGDYTITSDTQNGVTYSVSGNFANPSNNETVILTPSGTPEKVGVYNYTIKDGKDVTLAIVRMTFAYRQFRVMSYTSANYYGFRNAAAINIMGGTLTFGPNGVVPCEASPSTYNRTSMPTAAILASDLNGTSSGSGPADILYIGYDLFDGSANADIISIIKDFVFNKHGILIFNIEYGQSYKVRLVNELFNTGSTANVCPSSTTGGGNAYGTFQSGSPIVTGPFGNIVGLRQNITVSNSSYIYQQYMPVANSWTVALRYVNGSNPNAGLSILHQKLGVFLSFDGTFHNGGDEMPNASANATTGMPGTSYPTAILFANLFAWALEYGAYNINPGYQVSTSHDVTYPSTFVPNKPN
ncbi:MAG: hypothetical protein LBQ74_00405 [Prevotella sp.]|nr:hypothetical protein [Prevotella sp.]